MPIRCCCALYYMRSAGMATDGGRDGPIPQRCDRVQSLPQQRTAMRLAMKRQFTSIFQPSSNGTALSSDAVRLCATLRATLAEKDKLILVCSACAEEGVSTIAGQLGMALAMMSREPVLLVDANLHHPSLHEAFAVDAKPGLPDYVTQTLA